MMAGLMTKYVWGPGFLPLAFAAKLPYAAALVKFLEPDSELLALHMKTMWYGTAKCLDLPLFQSIVLAIVCRMFVHAFALYVGVGVPGIFLKIGMVKRY